MGNSLPKLGVSWEDVANEAIHFADTMIIMHHVTNGGCPREFVKAMKTCNPNYMEQRTPDTLMERWRRHRRPRPSKSSTKRRASTAALQQCFARNPTMFQYDYLLRMDEKLDQDLNPSPKEIKEQSVSSFRWWTGMRRS